MSGKPDQRFAILLTGEFSPLPCFTNCDGNDNVLSYGTDYEVELDLDGPVDFRGRSLSEKNGVIFVTSDSWLLQVNGAQGTGFYSAAYFDLHKGTISNEASNNFTIYGGWRINIYHPISTQKTTLFSFLAK
jgi:hypothetical protein